MPGERDRVLRNLRRRRIAVVGLGVSNQALLRFLVSQGVRSIAAADRRALEDIRPPAGWLLGLPSPIARRLKFGPDHLEVLDSADLIFLTPGIKKHLPEIIAARTRGAEISSEIGLFLSLCRARTVGITGSAGKTTTTTLAGEMLARSGLRVYVGGNIGEPLIEKALDLRPTDRVVLELSSFQLQLTDRSPEVAAVLNVAPNHLDVHRDYAEYEQAKRRVYRYQRPGDWVVLSADNPDTLAMARERGERVALFGRSEEVTLPVGLAPPPYRAYLSRGELHLRLPDRERPVSLCAIADVRLRGEHNLLNILAASLTCVLAGGSVEAAAQTAVSFAGVAHRLEAVGDLHGVSFINDSIATSPDRTDAALASYPGPLHLIAGGYDKKIPFDGLGESLVRCGKVRRLVLIGQTAPKIRRAVEEALAHLPAERTGPPGPEMVDAVSLEDAVRLAFETADPGTTVLLSPACASFDMFTNYEERGRAFREAVQSLTAAAGAARVDADAR